MTSRETLSKMDESLCRALQSGLNRIRLWQVPPNWSQGDWFQELEAVGTAAAWQAVCDFDPKRGVPLTGFGYSRVISHCLTRYRKEWTYAVHLVPSDPSKKEASTFKHTDLTTSSAARLVWKRSLNDDLHGAVGALPPEQRRLIKQLFWEERTEAEVADAIGTNQSTINRRKQAILKGLRRKLRDRNELQKFCIKFLVLVNLTNWCVGLPDIAPGA
jgi:RNA polymerase sigma factor (sigma-70 family)